MKKRKITTTSLLRKKLPTQMARKGKREPRWGRVGGRKRKEKGVSPLLRKERGPINYFSEKVSEKLRGGARKRRDVSTPFLELGPRKKKGRMALMYRPQKG